MEDDGIIMSSFNKSVPEEVKKKVMAEQAMLKAGKDTIFAGPLYDQNGKVLYKAGEQATDMDLLGMRVLVKGVSGKIPE